MSQLTITPRCLLGPGPSNVHPRVLQAMSYPIISHVDPQIFALMDLLQEQLRYAFQTIHEVTFPISGAGSAGMEAALCNFIEPGDSVLVCSAGYFADRMYQIAARYTNNVRRLEHPWGQVFSVEEIQAALHEQPARVVAIVHAETSTGARQPMEMIADIVHAQGGILVMDCVASLGGVPVLVDEWGVDVAYSGSQKCLSVPPGISPFTVGPRAMQMLAERKSPVSNYYLDLNLLAKYWNKERVYHHTIPISMFYALHEGLNIVQEEGLEARWERHNQNAQALWEQLEDLGFKLMIPKETRLPSVTTAILPQGLEDLPTRKKLLNDYNIEVAGGLGPLAGKIWRIGLMGYSSQLSNVTLFIGALKKIMGM